MKTIDTLYKGEVSNAVLVDYGFKNAKNAEDSNRMFKVYRYMFAYIIPFTYFSEKYSTKRAADLCFYSNINSKEEDDKERETETVVTKEKFHNACIKNKLVELLDVEVALYDKHREVLDQYMSLYSIDEYIQWYKQNKELFRNCY